MLKNKEEILEKAKVWFRETIVQNHIKNTRKLTNPKKFDINPFLTIYLANYLTGNSSPESIAKALIYPRVLGQSITTSFGTNIQKFASNVLEGFASTSSGIDIEYIDHIDGNRKYCQLKAGPNTINKDDVETIADHFKALRNLARTNSLRIHQEDMVIGLIYGTDDQLNGNYKKISSKYGYPVYSANRFWTGLTGDADFYSELVDAIREVAVTTDFRRELALTVSELSEKQEIISISSFSEEE
jgi:hypothetical protein